MNQSSIFIPSFSLIYVEKEAWQYEETHRIVHLLKKPTVTIEHYKNIFDNKRQDFQIQKLLPKLILAVKQDNFYYAGSEKINNFDNHSWQLYYNDIVRNCIYNCDYCILQALHPSAHSLVFVNYEDYFQATQKLLSQQAVYMSLSYISDILALEGLLGLIHKWSQFAHQHSHLLWEVRTKTDYIDILLDIEPQSNFILSWSLSSSEVSAQYEKGTASFFSRLCAIKKAVMKGFRVRLCLDPIIPVEGWEAQYSQMIKTLFSWIEADKIDAICFGFFRMSSKQFKDLRKKRQDSDLFQKIYRVHKHNIHPLVAEEEKMHQHISSELEKYMPKEKIFSTNY